MLTIIGLTIISGIISYFLFFPDSKFAIKRGPTVRFSFFILFVSFPIAFGGIVGNFLALKIGKNLPTYEKLIESKEYSNARVEKYTPSFKNGKHYLIALPSINGRRGIVEKVICN